MYSFSCLLLKNTNKKSIQDSLYFLAKVESQISKPLSSNLGTSLCITEFATERRQLWRWTLAERRGKVATERVQISRSSRSSRHRWLESNLSAYKSHTNLNRPLIGWDPSRPLPRRAAGSLHRSSERRLTAYPVAHFYLLLVEPSVRMNCN